MYVDTLITLQENLGTYAINGKKVSGHVTINSPGMIKCYIQNLKRLENGHEYLCYAFSKSHNKGVKIGALSTQRESRWKVNEKDIAGSGLNLVDLDAVAIVVENGIRGNDTVLMGFKNNRYMIMPLIDELVKGRQKPKQQEKKAVDTKINKLVSSKNIIQPDVVVEGDSSILKASYDKKENAHLKLQENQQTTNEAVNNVTTPSSIWTPGYNTNQVSKEPMNQGNIMSIQGGNAESSNMPNQNGNIEPTNQGSVMSIQGGNTESSNMPSQNENIEPTNQGIIMSIQNESGQESNIPISNGSTQEGVMQNNNGGDNSTQGNQNIMGNKALETSILEECEFDAIVATENLEDNTSILTKTAENLPEVEKGPAVSMSVQSGEAYATSVSQNASVVRNEKNIDELERIADQLSKELEVIIASLKGEEIAIEKLVEVEKQIESIGKTARSYSKTNRSMEQTLESRYTGKSMENDLVDNKEEFKIDTSPKNAVTYIQSCIDDGMTKQVFNKVHIMDKQHDISEEIDYLHEIDRKIQEIEQRRKKENRDS